VTPRLGSRPRAWTAPTPGTTEAPKTRGDAEASENATTWTVLLHCVRAQSRTPAVAAVYGARLIDRTPTEALADIAAVLPHAHPKAALQAALERLG
jgi:hypothetical protein